MGSLISPLLSPFPSLPCFQECLPVSVWFALRSCASLISVDPTDSQASFLASTLKYQVPACVEYFGFYCWTLSGDDCCLFLAKPWVPLYSFSVALMCPSLSVNLQTCCGVGGNSVEFGLFFNYRSFKGCRIFCPLVLLKAWVICGFKSSLLVLWCCVLCLFVCLFLFVFEGE